MNSLTNVNFSSRKLRKPLMERKRRARINRSLDELYELLTETDFAAKGAKLEKADILEMTVQYLKRLKEREGSGESKENLENVMLERYLSGFEKCAEEIETLVDPRLRHGINSHLKNCLERARTQHKKEYRGPGARERGETVRKPEDLRILPSRRLPNGDVLLLLSSSSAKREPRLGRAEVWRPWW